MFENEFQDYNAPRGVRKTRLSSFLPLLGGIMIGVVLVLAWQVFLHPAGPANHTGSPPGVNTPSAQSSEGGSSSNSPQSKDRDRPPYFWDIFKSQIAQGLHLSVDQVKTKLQTGLHIQDVAAAQGISQVQLHSLEIGAFQAADNEMVRRGFTTQPNISYDMQRWMQEGPMQLNGDVTNFFLQH